MCGRFTLTATAADLRAAFPWLKIARGSDMATRYNVAPGQRVAVVPNDGHKTLVYFRWGFSPRWARKRTAGKILINARAETLSEKPTFRAAYSHRRCLVLADGFYEWKKEGGSRAKTPVHIKLRSGEPFAFAGLWDSMVTPAGDIVRTCLVVTTTSNSLLEPIHHRMPVILNEGSLERWVDSSETRPRALDACLQPFPADPMIAWPVSTLVNNPGNDSPSCVEPA